MARTIVALTLAVAVLGGCSGSSSPSPSTATSTEPAFPLGPPTTPGPAWHVGPARPLGTGYLGRSSPDGTALYVEAVDAGLSRPGCEGLPEPVMFGAPVDGGARQAVLVDGATIRGTVIRGPEGRVALVKGCEAFVSDVWVGTEAADGTLAGVAPVPLAPDHGPLAGFGWSDDGSHLLAGHNGLTPSAVAAVVSIDPATGEETKLFSLEGAAARGVSQVAELPDGTYVVAGGGEVVLWDHTTGASLARAKGAGFALGTGPSFAVYGDGIIVLVSGMPHTVVHHQDGVTVGTAQFSPDGEAIVYTAGAEGVESVFVIGLTDAVPTLVAGPPGRYFRTVFTGDGQAVAFNRQADPAADPEVILVPVGR
ncbi:MAG: hypothetical protein QOG82_2166 [Actinomycetota bacterium]|nr:hypothetical protein [Actinomycetota bacterium]